MKKRKLVIEKMTTDPNNTTVENMRSFFQENPQTIGEMSPRTAEFVELDVEDLMKKTLPQYQRGFELPRAKSLVQSIIEHGYMPASIITVVVQSDKTISVHDGRHRAVACYILGIKTIPSVVVTFKKEAHEIRYFNTINARKTGTKLEQKILNEFQANDPLALLIYDLGYIDPNSRWSDKVALLGVEKMKDKMSLANFCKVVNWAGLGLRRRLEGGSNSRAINKLKNMTYEEIREGTNMFHDWFYHFANPVKVQNDVYHKDKVLISMLEFFYCSLRQPSSVTLLKPEKLLKTSVNSFRNYNFDMLNAFDAATAPDKLFDYFNKKRAKYPVQRL